MILALTIRFFPTVLLLFNSVKIICLWTPRLCCLHFQSNLFKVKHLNSSQSHQSFYFSILFNLFSHYLGLCSLNIKDSKLWKVNMKSIWITLIRAFLTPSSQPHIHHLEESSDFLTLTMKGKSGDSRSRAGIIYLERWILVKSKTGYGQLYER